MGALLIAALFVLVAGGVAYHHGYLDPIINQLKQRVTAQQQE